MESIRLIVALKQENRRCRAIEHAVDVPPIAERTVGKRIGCRGPDMAQRNGLNPRLFLLPSWVSLCLLFGFSLDVDSSVELLPCIRPVFVQP